MRHEPMPESEIEAAFFWAWWFTEKYIDARLRGLVLVPQLESTLSNGRSVRFDFAVFPHVHGNVEAARTALDKGKFIVVELDGHDFHERTKEQVKERNERDRLVQQQGGRIVHYSGSEIYRGALDCVADVVRLAESLGMIESK